MTERPRSRPWLAILLVLAAAPAAAGPVECGERPIRLAFYDFGYFHFRGSNELAAGIDKDIVDELERRTGCRFETRVMARARIWADLDDGVLDMSVSGIQTAERDRFAHFAHYLTMKNHAIVSRESAAGIRNAAEFIARPGLRFGVVRAFRHGTEQDAWLEQLREQRRVEESADVETVFRKLKGHRIDAMFSQPPVYRKLLADLGMEAEVTVADWTPRERGVPHGLILARSRFNDADATRWRAVIETMRRDGTIGRILHRYLPAAEAERMQEF